MLPIPFQRVLRKLLLPALMLSVGLAWRAGRLQRLLRGMRTALQIIFAIEPLQTAALPPPAVGNQVQLLVNGVEAYPALQQAISAARYTIRWQVMLFEPDDVGLRLAALLAQAARRGVRVQLSFDREQIVNGTPAARLSAAERARRAAAMAQMCALLEPAGVAVRSTSPGRLRFDLAAAPHARAMLAQIRLHTCLTANHYDHRKLLIIDDQVAFVGGMNVGEHYLYSAESEQRNPRLHWLDAMLRIEGPVVAEIAAEFDWKWRASGGAPISPTAVQPRMAGQLAVQFLRQHPGVHEIGARFFTLVQNARTEIFVASPFVSYRPAITALAEAARRGVRVTFVVPDGAQVQRLSQMVFLGSVPLLRQAGVQLYGNNRLMAHTKLLVVDGRWTLAGSFNLNYRSFLHDAEDAVLVDDEVLARQVIDRVFLPYLAISDPICARRTTPNLLRWFVRPFS